METKYSEEIITTSDLKKMRGKYLKENLYHKSKEEFIDEDTQEVVEIEKNQIVMKKGTYLDADKLAEIAFFLQSNYITEVTVTNLPRTAFLVSNTNSVWNAIIEINKKRKSIYFYATNIIVAISILQDYVEQSFKGDYNIISFKQTNYINLINSIKSYGEIEDDEEEIGYYTMNLITIADDDFTHDHECIIQARNIEDAKY